MPSAPPPTGCSHQPSLEIFSEFSELLLLKVGRWDSEEGSTSGEQLLRLWLLPLTQPASFADVPVLPATACQLPLLHHLLTHPYVSLTPHPPIRCAACSAAARSFTTARSALMPTC